MGKSKSKKVKSSDEDDEEEDIVIEDMFGAGEDEDDKDLDELDVPKIESIRTVLQAKYEAAIEMIDIMEFPENLPNIHGGFVENKKAKHCKEFGTDFWKNLPPKKQKKIVKKSRNEFLRIMYAMDLSVPFSCSFRGPSISKLAKAFREALTLDYAKRYCRLMKKAGLSKEEALEALERNGLPSKGARKAYRGLGKKILIGALVTTFVVAPKVVKGAYDVVSDLESDIEKGARMAAGEVTVVLSINPLDQIAANIPYKTAANIYMGVAVVAGGVAYAVSSMESKYCKPYDKMINQLKTSEEEVVSFAFKEDQKCGCLQQGNCMGCNGCKDGSMCATPLGCCCKWWCPVCSVCSHQGAGLPCVLAVVPLYTIGCWRPEGQKEVLQAMKDDEVERYSAAKEKRLADGIYTTGMAALKPTAEQMDRGETE